MGPGVFQRKLCTPGFSFERGCSSRNEIFTEAIERSLSTRRLICLVTIKPAYANDAVSRVSLINEYPEEEEEEKEGRREMIKNIESLILSESEY